MSESGGVTIFAPATAPGRAGIAIMRLSGPGVRQAIEALGCAVPAPRHATRARFRDAAGAVLDSGLILFFPAPASFTGEDVAELHLHGGRAVIAGVAASLSRVPGLRLAEPGEFSRRAFEHGKLDLTEAEAIADLVAAETAAQRRQALLQLDGALGRLYEDWRARLIRAAAHLEAAIDFPEEGLPVGIEAEIAAMLASLGEEITAHLADGRRGELLRDGVSIAILGPPNAGKSSLLNTLAQRDVAITSAVAGTTRDIIEVRLDLGGYPVILADTAGLRSAGDPVEQEGVRRAKARGDSADLRLVVLDATRLDLAEELQPVLGPDSVLVVNKVDLLDEAARRHLPAEALPLSVQSGEGMAALLGRLQLEVSHRLAIGAGPALTRERHRQGVEECLAAVERARKAGLPELAGEDLRLALRALGRITGKVDVEDLLDIVFRDFCIGK